MRFSTIFGAATCLSLTNALPTIQTRSSSISVTFLGAAGAQYTLTVPLDNTPILTNNALSISQVSSSFDVKDFCTIDTVDVPPALVEVGPGLWNVGPPQTVNSIACREAVGPGVQVVSVEFEGAAGAGYTVSVPLDGSVVPTNNALSISTIVTTYAGLPACKIVYVDFPAALVNTAPNTWSVGPPQTVESIQCFP